MSRKSAFTGRQTDHVNPFKSLPKESPVHFLGEEFTVKVIHTKYYRRDEYYKGISDSSQTVFAQTFNRVDIQSISALLNK